MTGGVEPELFQYVDDFSDDVRNKSRKHDEDVDTSWAIFTFCQLFFDQFFGNYGINIPGFTQRSREDVAELIEELKSKGGATREVRELVVLYEEFCDMYQDAHGGYGGTTTIDLLTFHQDYLSVLLSTSADWAASENDQSLSERVTKAITSYNSAIEEARWLIQ